MMSCSLSTNAPIVVLAEGPRTRWTTRNPARPRNARRRIQRRAAHPRLSSNRSRTFLYRRGGDPIRNAPAIPAIGAEEIGFETARTTRTIAPTARRSIPRRMRIETIGFTANRETCRRRGRKRRRTELTARRAAKRYARSVSWVIPTRSHRGPQKPSGRRPGPATRFSPGPPWTSGHGGTMAKRARGTPSFGFRIEDRRVADRVQHFPESVIREMTRVAAKHGAINLSQGFPDFDPPKEIVEAAREALRGPYQQYAITWGAKPLRDAIAAKAKRFNGIDADPEANVVVTCGATEAMMAAMLSVVDPGDEVVIPEPFYENYGPDAIVSGAKAKFVRMAWPTWEMDEEALKGAFTSKTKAIVLNTPNNPTGKVFSRQELKLIADLVEDRDALAITDEIYEHITYGGKTHLSIATIGSMADPTVTINGLSKTYSVTGWRGGWATATGTIAG